MVSRTLTVLGLMLAALGGLAFEFANPGYVGLLQPASAAAPDCATSQGGNTSTPDGATGIGMAAPYPVYLTRFIPTNSVTACKITFHLKPTGTPNLTLYAVVYSQTNDMPDSPICESAGLAASTLTAGVTNVVSFTVSVALTANTTNWIGLRWTGSNDTDNYVSWLRNSIAPKGVKRYYAATETWSDETTGRRGLFEVFSQ